MKLLNTKKEFGLITKLCHWSLFILIILQYSLIYTERVSLHKSFGLVVLTIAFLMVLFKSLGRRRPPHDNRLAQYTHLLLYVTLFMMPISGIFMSVYAGYPVGFFGHNLPLHLSINKTLSAYLLTIHSYTAIFLSALIALHIAGAFYHKFIVKDGIFKRML